jgi:hypothetical protein
MKAAKAATAKKIRASSGENRGEPAEAAGAVDSIPGTGSG